MWFLKRENSDETYYILPGKKKHEVGRTNADLALHGDSSISRTHANIIPSEDFVQIIDVGSKYGTYYYEENGTKTQLKKNVPIELKDGERIHFGKLSNEWKLSKLNVCTLVSTLTADHKEKLGKYLQIINGKIIDTWTKACTHLTMPEITVTLKVLQALVENIPVVSMKFWEVLISQIQEGKPLPNADDYLPTLAEKLLNKENISFKINAARKTLFSGKIFIFMGKKHYDNYSSIVTAAGGKCRNLNQNNVKKSTLVQKNAIVIRYIPSSQSQSSQTVDTITEYLNEHELRLIPEFEIGLAIIHCSLSKYCNPRYDISREFIAESYSEKKTGDVLVEETPLPKTELFVPDKSNTLDIPETEYSTNLTKTNVSEKHDVLPAGSYDYISETPQQSEIQCESKKAPKRKLSEENYPPSKKSNEDIQANSDAEEDLFVFTTTASSSKKQNTDTKRKSTVSANEPPNKKLNTAPSEKNIRRSEEPKQNFNHNLNTFLDKSKISQTPETDIPAEINNVLQDKAAKRPRIAILDNDDEDDLFDFGSATSKKPRNARNANEEQYSNSERSFKTPVQSQIVKKPNSKKVTPKRIVKPIEITSEGWLSKSLKEEIKDDTNDEIKIDPDGKCDKETIDWINTIKKAFVVKIKQMDLTTRTFRDAQNENEIVNTATSKGKNFKAFVKKRNYKPQKDVLNMVPFCVPGRIF